jgi:hypothetical protein
MSVRDRWSVRHVRTMWDEAGRAASVFRQFQAADRFGGSRLLYLKQDLLERYLPLTDQVLIWMDPLGRAHSQLQTP